MTKKMITNYLMFASMAILLAMTGVVTVHASEVTGTLSSDATNNPKSSGDIGGTVTNDNAVSDGTLTGTVSSGSSGGGGSSSSGTRTSSGGGGGSLSDTPSGSVLGESTLNTQTPNFPNAGFAPEEETTRVTVWSTIVTFFKNIISF